MSDATLLSDSQVEVQATSVYHLPFDNIRGSLDASLSRLIAQGQSADSRVGMLLSTNITMLGALVAIVSSAILSHLSVLTWVAATIALLLGASSIACVAYASFPRARAADLDHGLSKVTPESGAFVDHTAENKQQTVLFFAEIAKLEAIDYLVKIRALKQDVYLDDLALQCHAVAKIVTLKFRVMRLAFMCLFAAIVPWLLAVAGIFSIKPF